MEVDGGGDDTNDVAGDDGGNRGGGLDYSAVSCFLDKPLLGFSF